MLHSAEAPENDPTKPRRPRRRALLTAATLTIALAAIGGGLALHNQRQAAQEREERAAATAAVTAHLTAQSEQLDTDNDDLRTLVEAANQALLDSDGEITDDAVRQELDAQAEAARTLLAQPQPSATLEQVFEGISVPAHAVKYVQITTALTDVATTSSRLSTALQNVELAHADWLHARLGDAITAAELAAITSADEVEDPATLTALAEQITLARATYNAGAGATPSAEVRTARQELEDAAAGVATSHDTWLAAEQQRQAEAAENQASGGDDTDEATSPPRSMSTSTPTPTPSPSTVTETPGATSGANQSAPGSNGQLAAEDLCAIGFMPDHLIHCRAVADLEAFSAAYQEAFGETLPIDPWEYSTYRSVADQEEVQRTISAPIVATPGTSPHGWGLAIDFREGSEYGFGSERHNWLRTHGPSYGWVLQPWHQEDGKYREYWHFDYIR